MSHSIFKLKNAFLLAFIVSVVLILRQYTDYLINNYNYAFSWLAVSMKIGINYLIWALFFRVLQKIALHLLAHKVTVAGLVKHLALSMFISAIHRVLAVRLYDYAFYSYSGFMRSFLTPGNKVALGAGLFSSFLEYWIIMILVMAISYYSRYMQQQKELSSAKLNALKMQLQPHFLFNTLNSITSLIDIDSKKAQKMLTQLGFLMRELLEHDKKHFISLENEMQYIKTYLEIEHIRFQDRLSLNFKIEPNTLDARVPALLLQPIVENTIKHGISKKATGGEISIHSEIKNINGGEFLVILIANDYEKLNGVAKDDGFGIGVENVSNRLNQLYGKEHSYSNQSKDGKFYTEIKLPFQPI